MGRPKWSSEKWIEIFRSVHGDKYEYNLQGKETSKSYTIVHCKKHNYDFSIRMTNHRKGHGCPICNGGKDKPFTTEEFILKAKDKHGDLYDYSKVDYVNKNVPVEIICKKHGSFLQIPHYHICGNGCPYCKRIKTQYSIFELLKQEFPNEKWIWEYHAPWLGLQSIDIYNERVKLAIEYNGRQHYEPLEFFGGQLQYNKTIKLDKRKAKILQDNGCTLYVIKYDEYDPEKLVMNIKNILHHEIQL